MEYRNGPIAIIKTAFHMILNHPASRTLINAVKIQ